MDYRDYVRNKIFKINDRILEFGPLIRPIANREQFPYIFFADIRGTEDVKKLYRKNEYLESTGLSVDLNQVAEIDYVIKKSYKETFKNIKKFDVVYLSHVIEHMPDIIDFFQDIRNIINNKGKLVLIYPDARYCFDHFRNGTTFVDAYDVYKNKENSGKRVMDFYYNVVKENNPLFFWNNTKQNDILPTTNFQKTLNVYEKALKGVLPDDTHFWPFSDFQFIKFLYDMDRANLLDFEIKEFHKTLPNSQEFMVVLEPKNNQNKVNNYGQLLNEIDPIKNEIKSRKNIEYLKSELQKLKNENQNLSKEIKNIYNSKKWKYINKISEIKNKYMSKSNEK